MPDNLPILGTTATANDRVIADVALDRVRSASRPVLRALLEGTRRLADAHGARRLEVWIRHAQEADLVAATEAGFGVARRLTVLSLSLPRPAADRPDGAVQVRHATPGDEEDLVALLAISYDGTPDGGWTRERLAQRVASDWFRWEDVLVAEVDGAMVGVHWTKRRGGAIGEVYNLAVAPQARGSGVGASLLAAGLDHLGSVGMREALLWVDLANERAVRLYGSFGFVLTWEDVLLGRTLGA
jgi:mycothiol synthase